VTKIRRIRHVVYDISDVATWACWVLVGVVWLLGAVVARREGPAVQRHGDRQLSSLAAIATAVIIVATPRSFWHSLYIGTPWPRLAGVLLLVPATAAAVWARVSLGTMWSSTVVLKQEHVLRTSGPYRLSRHPIYTALLAMLAATALCQGIGRWAAIFVGVTGVMLLRVRAEERLLREEFPIDYPRYQREVPQLIPLPHRRRARRT
jgi:protein-S-isoprenylcysteine O-methyltransferase Ste14